MMTTLEARFAIPVVELLHREQIAAQEKAEENAARKRLDICNNRVLGTLYINGKTWKNCIVAHCGIYTLLVTATRGGIRREWMTTARLIEKAITQSK